MCFLKFELDNVAINGALYLLFLYINYTGLVAACLGQQLVLTHAPSYVKVQQQKEPLAVSDVPEVISNTLGLSDAKVSLDF